VAEEKEKPETENIGDKVISIVANQLDVEKEKIKPETSFINDLGADSLDIVELVMEFEEAFDMSIPDEDAEKIRTVGDAINYIKEHQG
jgi:acyl carrier protein